MNFETIDFGEGRSVTVIDGAVNLSILSNLYYLCTQLPYRIGNSSCREIQGIVDKRLKCDLEPNHPIVELLLHEGSPSEHAIKKYVTSDKYCFVRAYANLGIHSDVNEIHIDHQTDSKTILYYPNKSWKTHWGGQTMFLDDDGSCKKLVEIIPGRIVIFDGRIPHTVMPLNIRSTPSYRFTVALKFELIKEHTKDVKTDK
mgnify:FL=1